MIWQHIKDYCSLFSYQFEGFIKFIFSACYKWFEISSHQLDIIKVIVGKT